MVELQCMCASRSGRFVRRPNASKLNRVSEDNLVARIKFGSGLYCGFIGHRYICKPTTH